MKAKKDFLYKKDKEEYVIELKKKKYWWLLFFLLLLLPLILFIRLRKDVVFRTVDIVTETNLSEADVLFTYTDRNLLSTDKTIDIAGKTGEDGTVVFKKVSYTLYSKFFFRTDLSKVVASGGCFNGDSILPIFHNLKHRKEKLLKLPARSETVAFQVIDKEDNEPIPEADLELTVVVAKSTSNDKSKSDPHGMAEFQNIMFCSEKIIIVASKYGYKNDTIDNTIPNIASNLKDRTLELEPLKEMIKFTVKDLKSKQTVSNATAQLVFTSKTIQTKTNTNGVGKGAFEDVHILESISIKVTHSSYHDTSTTTYKVENYIKLSEKDRVIYLRPKTQSYTFINTEEETNSSLPGVKNEIYVNGKSKGVQYSNTNGTFLVPDLMNNDKITIKASKSGYYDNTTTLKNKKVSQLTNDNARTIPLKKVPPPPIVDPPRKNCRVHFSGTLLSDVPISGHISKIYVPDQYGEYVGEGEYPSNPAAFPKAVAATFDGIAVDKGTRLILYSKENFQGKVILDIKGPAVINNTKWKNERRIKNFKTKTFSGGLQANFPSSCRQWSKTNMHDWSNGSVKIICD